MITNALLRFCPPRLFLLVLPALVWGDVQRMVVLFLAHSGLLGCNLSDKAIVRKRLRQRLRGSRRDVAIRYLQLLGSTIHVHHSPDVALVILEAYAGIEPDDYSRDAGQGGVRVPPQKLVGKLRRLVGTSPGVHDYMYAVALANSCSHAKCRGGGAALAVIESFFGLNSEDYSRQRLQGKLGHLLVDSPGTGLMLIQQLAAYLTGLGFGSDARTVYLWFFDLTPVDLDDASRIADKVRLRGHLLPQFLFPVLILGVPVVLHPVLDRSVILGLVENLLEVTPNVYGDPVALAARLGFGDRSEQSRALAITLLQALHHTRQYKKSFAVLQALLLNGEGEAPEDIREVLAGIPRFIGGLYDHQKAAFHQRVLHTVFGLGELALAADYAERLFQITKSTYAGGVPYLARSLREACPGFAPEEDPLLFSQLIATLIDMPNRENDAQMLLEAYLWEVLELSRLPVENAVAVMPVCWMIELWLSLAPSAVAFPRCTQIVSFVRQTLNLRGVRFEDRANFGNEIAALRRQIVRVGREQALSNERLWIDVLGWDVELGQRVLFERYRFHRPMHKPMSSTDPTDAADLKNGWSLREKAPNSDDYLPPVISEENGRARLGFAKSMIEPILNRHGDLADSPDDRYRCGEQIVSRGITVQEIAQVLGEKTVLLRAGFAADGHLVWTAYRSDARQVALLAHGRSSGENALEQTRSAVRWHDALLDQIWVECGHADGHLRLLLEDLILSADCIVRELGRRRWDGSPRPDVLDRSTSTLVEKSEKSGFGSWFTPWLRSAIPSDWRTALGSALEWKTRWENVLKTMRLLSQDELDRRLDAATEEYLAWVGRHWDLTPLLPHLHADNDLVVEVEDHLHAVPAAFLPVRAKDCFNQLLFERTRSVRSSVSLLIGLLRPNTTDREVGEAGTLLTFSWFESEDPARCGARWLHHGQQVLAKRHNLAWKSASDWSSESAKLIADAVAASARVRMLTVCGHGDPEETGIRLRVASSNGKRQTDLWAGEGCDLSTVDWLLSVSCSVGRIAQQPDIPDVAGFTADLLARRASAALACRWPVHSLQAAAFANAVADEYLDRKRQSGRADRAAALARGRSKFFCNAHGRRRIIGLNTLAAFELYGEG